jgi:septum formation protein
MALWIAGEPIVLASKSTARLALLAAAGITVEVLPADIDERGIEAKASEQDAGAVAALLAQEKARAVAAQRPGRMVLGADQTLVLGQQRFSKPADRAATAEQLRALRGGTHSLHSAVTVMRDSEVLFEYADAAHLTMRAFSDKFLEEYLDAAGDLATTSVGGYRLEGPGIQLFERIEGDYFTILGLPLLPLLHFLRRERCLVD